MRQSSLTTLIPRARAPILQKFHPCPVSKTARKVKLRPTRPAKQARASVRHVRKGPHLSTADQQPRRAMMTATTSSPSAPAPSSAAAASMVHCKLTVDGLVRRFSVPDADAATLPGLRAALAAIFPTLPVAAALSFVDDDGDACALTSDADVREALAVSPTVLRLRLAPPARCAGKNAEAARHPLPFLAAVAPRAAGPALGAALDAVVAAPPVFAEGVKPRQVTRVVGRQLGNFLARQRQGRGAVAAAAALSDKALADCRARVENPLVAAGAAGDRVALVVAAVEAALHDPGARAALFEAAEAADAVGHLGAAQETAPKGGADGAAKGRGAAPAGKAGKAPGAARGPLPTVLAAIETDAAREAVRDLRRLFRDSDADAKLVPSVRPAIRRTTIRFVRQHIAGGPGAPLKPRDAASAYGAEVKKIAGEAGMSAGAVAAVELVARALAGDAAVRAAAVSVAKAQAEKRAAERAAGAAARDADVTMAALAVANAPLEERLAA
jgi:hypothetical protein